MHAHLNYLFAETCRCLSENLLLQDSVLKMLPGKAITVEYSAANAIEQLKNEPMFCMELSVRLFYWSRLAYLHGVSISAWSHSSSPFCVVVKEAKEQ